MRADLEWLRAGGWDTAIERHLRYGGKVIGLCGGYQMLGLAIDDLRVSRDAGQDGWAGLA